MKNKKLRTLLNLVTAYLEDISQTFFFKNALFGAGLLILFFCFNRTFFFYGIGASLIAYGYTLLYSTPKILKSSGLITINGFFLGIAIAGMYHHSPVVLMCLLLGALAIPLVTKAVFEVLQHWKLSPFVIPYILCVWTLCLCGSGLNMERNYEFWPAFISTLPAQHPDWHLAQVFLMSVGQSIGRLLFLPNAAFGALILALVFAFKPRKGFYLLMGTVLGTLLSGLISSGFAWEYGFFSFSAGLVGLGIAARPERLTFSSIMLFCAISAILTLAADQFLRTIGLPVLSLPFVSTMWMAVLSRSPRFNVSWGPNRAVK